MEKTKYLEMKRMERLNALRGQWVVLADSPRHPGEVMYFQDQELVRVPSKSTLWTSFLPNAQGFKSKDDAKKFCMTLRFNNPRIMQV